MAGECPACLNVPSIRSSGFESGAIPSRSFLFASASPLRALRLRVRLLFVSLTQRRRGRREREDRLFKQLPSNIECIVTLQPFPGPLGETAVVKWDIVGSIPRNTSSHLIPCDDSNPKGRFAHHKHR